MIYIYNYIINVNRDVFPPVNFLFSHPTTYIAHSIPLGFSLTLCSPRSSNRSHPERFLRRARFLFTILVASRISASSVRRSMPYGGYRDRVARSSRQNRESSTRDDPVDTSWQPTKSLPKPGKNLNPVHYIHTYRVLEYKCEKKEEKPGRNTVIIIRGRR